MNKEQSQKVEEQSQKTEEQSQKMELPINVRIEQARDYLRLQITTAAIHYNLSGPVIDLIIETLLAEEQKQRISLMAEQFDTISKDRKEK